MAQNGLEVEDDSGEMCFIRFTRGMFGFSSEPYENMEGCDDDFARRSKLSDFLCGRALQLRGFCWQCAISARENRGVRVDALAEKEISAREISHSEIGGHVLTPFFGRCQVN